VEEGEMDAATEGVIPERIGRGDYDATVLSIGDVVDVLMVGEVVGHGKLHDVGDDAVCHQMKVPSSYVIINILSFIDDTYPLLYPTSFTCMLTDDVGSFTIWPLCEMQRSQPPQ
ncbi:hypothetical protein KI387_035324, partial [Taxus chinensis]